MFFLMRNPSKKTNLERNTTMKNAKRIASLLLVLAMVFAMAISASALTEVTPGTGSILVKDNETVLASRKTFAAYKVLDLKAYTNDEGEIVNYEYTVPADLADFYATRYNLDKTALDFAIKVMASIDSEPDIYDFAKDILEVVTAAAFTGKPVENGYQFTGLPLGYYVIEDTTAQGEYKKPVSALILDTATPDVEIEVKAEKPPVDKKIDNDNDFETTEDRVDANQAAIGDTVSYVISSVVPDMTGYNKYYFIMNDTLSKGLTYTNTMTVKVGDKVLTEGTDYTNTIVNNEDGTTSMRIVFNNFLQYNTEEFIGKPVEVTYTAELNKDAEVNKTPNTNKVNLEYSNDPNVDYNGENEPNPEEPPIGITPDKWVKTFTTTLEIVKVDPIGNRLQGAEFTLSGNTMNIVRVEAESFDLDPNGEYWKLKDGSFTTTDPESTIDGAPVDKSTYASLTDKYTKTTNVTFEETEGEAVTIKGVVGEDGILRFEGIKAGDYVIEETKAPEGYNILTEKLNVSIDWNEETYEFTYTGAVDNNGVARLTVVNQTGSELPSTGGIGTTVFYVLGGVLVFAAIVLLVTKKRMGAAK